jgi:hypothetical protein
MLLYLRSHVKVAGVFTSYSRRLLASTPGRQRSLGRSTSVHAEKNILFSKYVSHETDANGVEAVYAWLLTAHLPLWQYPIFFLGLSWPSKDSARWKRVEVLALWTDMRFGGGSLKERPVNPFDCDKQLTIFVKPFVQLYQVRSGMHVSIVSWTWDVECTPYPREGI